MELNTEFRQLTWCPFSLHKMVLDGDVYEHFVIGVEALEIHLTRLDVAISA